MKIVLVDWRCCDVLCGKSAFGVLVSLPFIACWLVFCAWFFLPLTYTYEYAHSLYFCVSLWPSLDLFNFLFAWESLYCHSVQCCLYCSYLILFDIFLRCSHCLDFHFFPASSVLSKNACRLSELFRFFLPWTICQITWVSFSCWI